MLYRSAQAFDIFVPTVIARATSYSVPRPVTRRVHWMQLHHQLHRQLHHHPVAPFGASLCTLCMYRGGQINRDKVVRLITELLIYMRSWKWVSVMLEAFGSCCQLLVTRGSKLPRTVRSVATTLRRVLAHLTTRCSLPSLDGETERAELPARDIQCRTQVLIVDLDILSLLYLSEVFTFHYYRLFYHRNNATCRYLRAEPQRHAPSGHHVGHVYDVSAPHGLSWSRSYTYRLSFFVARGRHHVPRAHAVAAQLGDSDTSRYFHGKTNGSNEMWILLINKAMIICRDQQ